MTGQRSLDVSYVLEEYEHDHDERLLDRKVARVLDQESDLDRKVARMRCRCQWALRVK